MQITITMFQFFVFAIVGLVGSFVAFRSLQDWLSHRMYVVLVMAFFAFAGSTIISGFSLATIKLTEYRVACRIEKEKIEQQESKLVLIKAEKKERYQEERRVKAKEVRAARTVAEERNWAGEWRLLRKNIQDCKGNYGLIRHTLEQFKENYACTDYSLTREAYLRLTAMIKLKNVNLTSSLEETLADNFLECVDTAPDNYEGVLVTGAP